MQQTFFGNRICRLYSAIAALTNPRAFQFLVAASMNNIGIHTLSTSFITAEISCLCTYVSLKRERKQGLRLSSKQKSSQHIKIKIYFSCLCKDLNRFGMQKFHRRISYETIGFLQESRKTPTFQTRPSHN